MSTRWLSTIARVFACAAVAAAWGCAITDYEMITDNDQLRTAGNGSTVVNTNGKAHMAKKAG